jgi:hypothetical protein
LIYWIIFKLNNGESQEIILNGWDVGSIKNLFYYLRGKFPSVKFNSIVLKDSPAKLAGVEEYLKK